jgi:hypothetical protein
MNIQVLVHPDGTVEAHAASVLSDLWDDYCYFRKLSQEVPPSSDLLVHKRYVRAALWTLFAYFEGVVNRWIAKIDKDFDINNEPLPRKIDRVRREIHRRSRGQRDLRSQEIRAAKSLRNRIAHLDPRDDQLDLVERLSNGSAFRDADRVVAWLKSASRVLRMECHPDVRAILDDYVRSLGRQEVGAKSREGGEEPR